MCAWTSVGGCFTFSVYCLFISCHSFSLAPFIITVIFLFTNILTRTNLRPYTCLVLCELL